MSVPKMIKRKETPTASQQIFKPSVSAFPSITESDEYILDIRKAKHNAETGRVVLVGTPSRILEDESTQIFKDCPVCLPDTFESDDFSPLERLFNACNLDIATGCKMSDFVGKKVCVYIDVNKYPDGSKYYNGTDFAEL